MDAHVVAEMAAREEDHWWYVGLRDLLGRLLTLPQFAPPPDPRILDAGCGTGATLRFLHSHLRPAYLGGFDIDPLCLEFARHKCPEADVYAADFGTPIFSQSQFDLIVSCDVLSYVDPESRRNGLRRLVERLSPQGRILLHVPACPWLYGRHDRAVGTRERFTASGLRALAEEAGLTIELLTYRLCLTFPAVAAMRLWSRSSQPKQVSDLGRGGRFLNSACRRITAVENAVLRRKFRFPFGSSLLLVAKPAVVESAHDRGAN